jgi:hypothetical protein
MQQDTMALVGMTTPQDTFNPEVMAPGNSGAKLQLAMGPNQIIQDNTVRNCAEGLKEAIWLVWRTLIQYGDDYGVKKLAQNCHPDKTPVFLDAQAFDDMNFCERAQIHIDLALGMKSEENSLQRLQIIKQTQTGLMQEVQQLVSIHAITPELFKKIRKPYEDTLYTLGVKDCDVYLPTEEEVMQMVKQAMAAQPQPDPKAAQAAMAASMADTASKAAKAKLDNARADQINADVQGNTAERQLEGYSLIAEHKAKSYGAV